MPDHSQQTTWFEELWPRLAIASGVGYVATAYAVSRWLTRRSPAALEMPTHLGHCTVEALECRTADGVDLKGWSIEPAKPRATVVLFHGMRCNRADLLERIAFLTAAGYRCIAFDHRAHGESGGRVCTFGYRERHDVVAVLNLVRDHWPNAARAAIGVSMGAAAICFASEIARGFDALILESVYTELARAFDQRIGCEFPSWFRHFRNGVVWFTERRLGTRVDQVTPLAHIAHLAPRPVLLITGSEDPHTPPDEVRLLACQIPTTSRFHVIQGAGHEDVCSHGGIAYQALLLTFLEQHLGQVVSSAAA